MTKNVMRWMATLTATGLCLTVAAASVTAAEKQPTSTKPAAATGSSATKKGTAASAKTTGTNDKPASGAVAPAKTKAAADSMTLRGGESGTMFDALTIEGEDRIRIDFDRPPLDLAIDPLSAPGLAWNRSLEVIDRGALTPERALLERSAGERCPYLAKPYISVLATGPVVRFAPKVTDVERWSLSVADSRGRNVAAFGGTGRPPAEITWDGITEGGAPALPGLTYSFVLEAHDRAGNKRNFMGDAFEVRPYVRQSGGKLLVLFTGKEIAGPSSSAAGSGTDAPVLLETASRLNQLRSLTAPIHVEAHARTMDQAKTLADRVAGPLRAHVLGDPARLSVTTTVEPDAPETGSIMVMAGS
jgi:hypothetical protein